MEILRRVLLPFSFLYWCGVTLRNMFFDKGIFRTTKFSTPVISVGNLSIGGTGKTPLVELLIEYCSAFGTLAVVSRGYARKSRGTVVVSNGKGNFGSVLESGDEPMQIARKYPSTIVVVDEDRSRGVRKAIELGATMIVLDDGFQHRFVERDIDIVVLPVSDVLRRDGILPAGRQREPWSSLRRCQYIILTCWNNRKEYSDAKEKLKEYGKPVIGVAPVLTGVVDVSTSAVLTPDVLRQKRVALFSGIGNPKNFESTVRSMNATIVSHSIFSDHHWYSEEEFEKIVKNATEKNADALLTTEKDAVRIGVLKNVSKSHVPLYAVRIQQRCSADEENFRHLITTIEYLRTRK